jgi:hypothetical protein
LNCGETGPSDRRSTAEIRSRARVAGAERRRRRTAAVLAGDTSGQRFRGRFSTRDDREAPGRHGELTRTGPDSSASLVRAGDEEQRAVDGELRRDGDLMVGGEVGDFGKQQGAQGNSPVALDRCGKLWFALASTISGLRRRSSSAMALWATLLGFAG